MFRWESFLNLFSLSSSMPGGDYVGASACVAGPGCPPNAPAVKDEARRSGGRGSEGMKTADPNPEVHSLGGFSCVDLGGVRLSPRLYAVVRDRLRELGFLLDGSVACFRGDARTVEELVNKAIADAMQLVGPAEDEGGDEVGEEVDWGVVEGEVVRRFRSMPSQLERARLVVRHLRAGNNVLLAGPPGSGKSYLMDVLGVVVPHSYYISMANASNAGIEDLVLNARRINLLMIDELDKASTRDLPIVLQLADATRGRVVIAKANKRVDLRLHCPILAAANPFLQKRSRNYWDALLDRFVLVEFERPSREELMALFIEASNASDQDLLRAVEKSIEDASIRRIMQAANFVRGNPDFPRELLIKEVVRILNGGD